MTNLFVRQRIEEFENNLSPYATKSRLSRGRIKPEEQCPLRTVFQRDRDRILYSNAFRRLKHKTQVFIAPLGDHYVTRLTHTLEVSQIARTISRALAFNEDLTEAIALGHDLGHTPFGHLGEEILDRLCPDGFRHNEQSLRVVDVIEKYGQGLNLTWEVRDGILNHSKSYAKIPYDGWCDVGTVEGQVVKIADIIAYINHDTSDAIRAGVITEKDIPETVIILLGKFTSERINTLVVDLVSHTLDTISQDNPEFPTIGMSQQILEAANYLREFLFDKVYNSSLATTEKDKVTEIVHTLFTYFLSHHNKLPSEYDSRDNSIERKIVDYIAGMTDDYAVRMASSISGKTYSFAKLL